MGSSNRELGVPAPRCEGEVVPSSAALGPLALPLLETLITTAPVGFALLDTDLRFVLVNRTLAELNGVPVEAHLGRTVREVLPALADDVEPLLRRVLDTGRALVDVEVETGETPRNPGRRRHWLVSYYPVPAPERERPYGLGLLVNDVTEHHEREEERARLLAAERTARAAAERAAERQMLLQRLTAQLGRAATIGEVAAVTISTVPAALGAEAAMVYRNDEGTFRLLAVTGLPESVVAGWETFTLEATAPAVDALRAGRSVLVGSRAERDRRYPFLAGTAVTQAAWANLPLRVGGRTVGLAAFGWAQPRTFTGEEAELLAAVASQCAAALDRARLLAAEQATRAAAETARARLAFLAQASDVLSGSLNEAETLDRLARLIAHDRADWCTVLLPDGRGHLVPRVCVHADPAKAALAAQVPSTGPFEIA
ncbi:MAG TPA: PAS domain-containing protein, partial [Frankiaceae bacterium]|nr:PAS domain-containing protein [Frankiaceae bacterium]